MATVRSIGEYATLAVQHGARCKHCGYVFDVRDLRCEEDDWSPQTEVFWVDFGSSYGLAALFFQCFRCEKRTHLKKTLLPPPKDTDIKVDADLLSKLGLRIDPPDPKRRKTLPTLERVEP